MSQKGYKCQKDVRQLEQVIGDEFGGVELSYVSLKLMQTSLYSLTTSFYDLSPRFPWYCQ